MSMRKSTQALLATCCLFILQACNNTSLEPIAADDYFPLSKGHSWQYRTTTLRGGKRTNSSYEVHNLGEVERDFAHYRARKNGHGTEYFFRRDDSGVYRLGVQTVVSNKIKPDTRKRYVLKTPHRKDDYWFSDSHAFVIERTQPVHERFWNSHAFEMEYQITELNETVQVPAGTFEHCIRVQGTGIVKLLADVTQGRYGSAEGDIITTEWYAPGVGLIKLVRQESFENSLFSDGSYSMELTESTAGSR